MDVTRRICNGILGSLILCGSALSEEKPKIKIPEAKKIIKEYVENLSDLYKKHKYSHVPQRRWTVREV